MALHRSVDETAEGLGADGDAYRGLLQPLVEDWDVLLEDLLGPLRIPRNARTDTEPSKTCVARS